MKRPRAFAARLIGIFFAQRRERELAAELDSHLQMQIEDNLRSGMTPDQARREALLKLGGLEQTKQACRDRGTLPLLENGLRNLRFSLRMLRKNPGMTAIILLTLALGIGAVAAIFTVDYATLLAPLPYPQANQLVMVWSRVQGHRNEISAGDYMDWKRQTTVFQDLNAQISASFNIATGGQPENVDGRSTTPGLYRMLGYSFMLGRDFLPEEGEPGKDHEAILTHKFWQRMGGNPRIVGTTMRINGAPYTIVGVLAPGLTDRGQGELVVPLSFRPEQLEHQDHWITVMGRLKPGVTLQQAQENMNSVAANLAQTYPKTNKGWSAMVEPLKNDFIPSDRIRMLWLLLGAVGFVLLIACVNVANLLLARSMSRQKELAVRSALGASSATIFAQLLTESLVLAIAGGALGVGVGYAMLQGFIAVTPPNTLPSEADLRLNLPILIVTFAITTIAGLLFGCAPAWFGSRADPAEALQESGRAGAGSGRNRLRRALIVGEFALALTLLAGAGLAIHSFWNLLNVDTGVRADHVFGFSLNVPESRSKDPASIDAYYRQILSSIQSVPGISNTAAMTGVPLDGTSFAMSFSFAGEPAYTDPSLRPGVLFDMVTPDYFRTFGIRLIQGRVFSNEDSATSVKVAMVNADFVRMYLQGKQPLQQRLIIQQLIPGESARGAPAEWQIVGVFHTIRFGGLRRSFPEIIVPFWQSPWPSAFIGVRTTGDPLSALNSVAAAVHTVDAQIPLASPRTMDQLRDDALAEDRFIAVLFASFAAIALFLAALGIYGVMGFSVAQRSKEIALRIALGATRKRVMVMVVRESLTLACGGLGLGLLGAYCIGRTMRGVLYGVGTVDYSAFVCVALVLLAAALLASYLPARRAASIEPMEVLRME